MFFDDKSTPSKTTPNELHCQAADRLLQLVKKVRGVLRWSRKSWANEIRLLCAELDNQFERVEKVLTYMELPSTKGLRPTSAKWFRRNFYWIEERSNKSKVVPQVKPEDIDPEAKKLYQQLKGLGWGKQALPQLLTVIHNSLMNLREFRTRLKRISKLYQDGEMTNKAKLDYGRFANWLVTDKVINVSVFLTKWFEDVHHQILNWKDWSGNLNYFTFTPDHKMGSMRGCAWAMDYTGNPDCWWKLLKGMSYAGEAE